LIAVVALSAVALIAAGCGGSKEEQAAKDKQACQAAIGQFVTALQDLDGRLDVGIAYTDYGSKVGDIAAAHARIDTSAEALQNEDCLNIATEGESALQSYAKANEIWTHCVQRAGTDPNCARPLMLRRLREQWSDASRQVEQVTAALASFGQSGASANTNCPPGQTANENGYCG